MQKKERIIWSAVLIVILVITVLTVASYQTKINSLSQKVADFEEDMKTEPGHDAELTEIVPINNSEVINSLQRQGFDGELQDIIDDLTNHSELIPFEGVLGGKMGFYKEDIHVISDKWVLAKFEDGHIGGNMLLSYSIKNNNISWEVLDSYLFN